MANGRLPASQLSAIPGGRLRHDAAAAWNDMRDYIGKKHGVWIAPTGSRSSYRSYDEQVYFWNLYISGRGNLAARPGSSNHGWGVAVDVATQIMVYYIKKYGHLFGWKKTEAFGEWWHYNYIGGYKSKPKAKMPKLPNVFTKVEKTLVKRLARNRFLRGQEKQSGRGPKYYRYNVVAKATDLRLRARIKLLRGKKYHRPARRKALQAAINGKYNYR